MFCDGFVVVNMMKALEMSLTASKHMLESLAQDVVLVLRRMGGSAHQNLVVDCVAAMRRERGEAIDPRDLRQMIAEVFEYFRDMFFRPFGEGSQRWALAPGVA